ncbi:MAG: hypothetical protein H8D45_07845 [Bacteroidetes bacterium]|nr:hypothetical protein [Bacteroidota bacterium]
MDKLLLYTAGSSSREILLAIDQLNELDPTWDVLGFVDENPEIIGKEVCGYPVYGPDHKEIASDVYGVCGIMNPQIRRRIIEELIEGKGLSLATIIHPSVILPLDIKVGPGTIIMPSVNISYEVKIGKGTFVLWGSLLGHNVCIGNYSMIMSSANILAGCSVGDMSTIGTGATLNVNVSIGQYGLVGVGTTVLRDLGDSETVVSLPRQLINKR